MQVRYGRLFASELPAVRSCGNVNGYFKNVRITGYIEKNMICGKRNGSETAVTAVNERRGQLMKKKRFLSILLSVAMMLGLMPGMGLAAYASDGSETVEVKIAPTVTAPTAKTLTYTGEAQELVNAGSTEDGTLYYALGENDETAPEFDGTSGTENKKWSTSIPTAANAGTYYVWYKVVGDVDHNDTSAVCVTVTIMPLYEVWLEPVKGTTIIPGMEKDFRAMVICNDEEIKVDDIDWMWPDSADQWAEIRIDEDDEALLHIKAGNLEIDEVKEIPIGFLALVLDDEGNYQEVGRDGMTVKILYGYEARIEPVEGTTIIPGVENDFRAVVVYHDEEIKVDDIDWMWPDSADQWAEIWIDEDDEALLHIKAGDLEIGEVKEIPIGFLALVLDDEGNYQEVGRDGMTVTVISKKSIADAVITGLKDVTYNGKARTQKIKVTVENVTLIEGTDYEVTYTDNTNAGTAKMILKGINGYKGSIEVSFTIKPASIKGAKVTPKKTSMVWTGKALKPGVKSVVLKDGTKLAATDYSLSYKNNTNAGTAKIIVKGKGNYTGTATGDFKITKAEQKVKTVTPAKKTIAAGKSFKIKAKATKEQGTAQFKKVSGNAKITINSSGKVTVKKGTKAGKYTVKYKVRIKQTKNCKATKYVTKSIVITVK